MKKKLLVCAAGAAAVVLMAPAVSMYYEYSGGEACAGCHEIRPTQSNWLVSSHRSVACRECHGDALSADVAFHMNNLRRVITHVRGEAPERIHLRLEDVSKMVERCRSCHRQEFAQWASGPHSTTYARIFLDKEHNSKELLEDDCLRCHGQLFDAPVRDLVTPVNTKGPWRLLRGDVANLPAIPCMECHQMHRQGQPMMKRTLDAPGAGQEIARPSLALFDRRERGYFALGVLPIPAMLDGARPVRMSPDTRQALCYQCHAPESTRRVGSGDDRTAMGVHEGLSCMACHESHGQQTRASCSTCHPRLSNCGIDVEKMDTTFRDAKSKHNVHFVKCADCHPRGVPKKKEALTARLTATARP